MSYVKLRNINTKGNKSKMAFKDDFLDLIVRQSDTISIYYIWKQRKKSFSINLQLFNCEFPGVVHTFAVFEAV